MTQSVSVALVLALALVVGGCAGEPASRDPNAPAVGPLTALAECTGEEMPAATGAVEIPDGAQMPDGFRPSDRIDQGPLVQLTGFVESTPVELRLAFEEREDLEKITIEDEIFEAEILVSDGAVRTYLRVNAICQTGSAVLAVIADEVDSDAVPVPAGGAASAPAPVPTEDGS